MSLRFNGCLIRLKYLVNMAFHTVKDEGEDDDSGDDSGDEESSYI